MTLRNSIVCLAAALAFSLSAPAPSSAEALTAKSVVLVHGAFADGSSWHRVAPILQEAGLEVIAVQNPLDSLEGDVAFTVRAIERAEGPVVLVGHSWGGVVITEAGDHDKVQSLVYVAAYAPEEGQSLLDVAEAYPAPAGIKSLVADEAGYLHLPAAAVAEWFAQDLTPAETAFMTVSQGALNSAALKQPVSKASWQEKPVFYAISGQDHMTPSQLQRNLAKKLNATTIEVDASHASMLSQPNAIAELIIEAAR